jgi:DNA-binding protein H-NS
LLQLWQAAVKLQQEERDREIEVRNVIEAVRERCQQVGLREVARQAGVDASNLAKVLSGQRSASQTMLANLEARRSNGKWS